MVLRMAGSFKGDQGRSGGIRELREYAADNSESFMKAL